MAGIEDILNQIPMSQLAGALGVDESTAQSMTKQALPALLAGMGANAKDPQGAVSLNQAVRQHAQDNFSGEIDLSKIDTADGEKIVGHVFGEKKADVAAALGGGGQGSNMMQNLLPMLAPIVMGFLAKQMGGGGAASAAAPGGGQGGGGLADILGGMLGGGGSGGGDLGGLLEGLLGGGRR